MASLQCAEVPRARKIWSAVLLAFGFVLLLPAHADCLWDCKDKYDSDAADCQIRSNDSSELQRCIDAARVKYNNCQRDCSH